MNCHAIIGGIWSLKAGAGGFDCIILFF